MPTARELLLKHMDLEGHTQAPARLLQEHLLEGKKQFEVFTLGTEWEVVWVPCSVAVIGTMGDYHII